MAKSKFLKVACPRCQKNQIVFGKACLEVKCLGCNYLLNKTSGGKAKVRGSVKKVLWK